MNTKERAYILWNEAGRPFGHDLDFWVRAEREMAVRHICVLSPGSCPHQKKMSLSGGRSQSICTSKNIECGNRASDKI